MLEDRILTVAQMVGHPKHVKKAIEAGVDLICAQAGEVCTSHDVLTIRLTSRLGRWAHWRYPRLHPHPRLR